MKNEKKLQKSRGGIWILIVAAVVLEAISCIMYFTSRAAIRSEAEQRAKTELRKAELEIEKHTIEMEAAARTLAMLAEKNVHSPEYVYACTRFIVSTIEHTTSVAVAYMPDYFPEQGHYFEVCSSRISKDSIYTRQIGSAEHDYTQMEWFRNGLIRDSCWWCEPYLDDSGSQAYVVSCSYPVHDEKGTIVAVVCVDLPLDYLQQVSEYLQIYPKSHYSIVSQRGVEIVPAPDTIPGRKYQIYNEEIDATGWFLSIIIPEEELFHDLNHVGKIVGLLMLIGLALLVFLIVKTSRDLIRLVNLSNERERIESELNIASSIQSAMLPTRFPPFPDYPNLNAHGVVIPAREVGGDLFDFYIRDNRLFFCIGDVSGKGVPASIVMAMTRSLFRSFCSYVDSPAQIVSQMNDSLAGEGNDQNMFVTLFLGILDLHTGELNYCNAGHDAPVHMRFTNEALPVVPNLPLGIVPGYGYQAQDAQLAAGDTLFLYTDGLTEAENTGHELFGFDRMMDALEPKEEAKDLIDHMMQAVKAHVGEAEQSDDLTMFVIRYLGLHTTLVMRNDIQQIPTLAEWLDTIGMPENLNMPMNLALEEAVTNVMLYAYPNGHGRVLVEAMKEADRLTFTISDSGIPFDPTKQEEPDLTLAAEERQIGGLGIHLVRQIMDEISYERKDNKNILTLVKQL